MPCDDKRETFLISACFCSISCDDKRETCSKSTYPPKSVQSKTATCGQPDPAPLKTNDRHKVIKFKKWSKKGPRVSICLLVLDYLLRPSNFFYLRVFLYFFQILCNCQGHGIRRCYCSSQENFIWIQKANHSK